MRKKSAKEFYELSSNKTLDELGDDGVMGIALLIRKAILLSPKLSPEQKKQQLQEWDAKYPFFGTVNSDVKRRRTQFFLKPILLFAIMMLIMGASLAFILFLEPPINKNNRNTSVTSPARSVPPIRPRTPPRRANPRKRPEPKKRRKRIKLKIKKKIFFDYKKATIKKKSHHVLDYVVHLMIRYPSMHVRIEGHTDERGLDKANRNLSKRRAEAVMRYLIKKGIDPSRLGYKGFGEKRPLDSRSNEVAWAKNRRVDFIVTRQPTVFDDSLVTPIDEPRLFREQGPSISSPGRSLTSPGQKASAFPGQRRQPHLQEQLRFENLKRLRERILFLKQIALRSHGTEDFIRKLVQIFKHTNSLGKSDVVRALAEVYRKTGKRPREQKIFQLVKKELSKKAHRQGLTP